MGNEYVADPAATKGSREFPEEFRDLESRQAR
jgi:hypothetical protein